jgi:hypothetical protein
MASILTFPTRDRPIGAAIRNSVPAKIIIFPGVRYERRAGPETTVTWPLVRPLSPLSPLQPHQPLPSK